MKIAKFIIVLILTLALVCTGCTGNSSKPLIEDKIAVEAVTGSDYRDQGMISYSRIERNLTSSAGCEVTYTYFRPGTASKDLMVILGHGFLRSKGRMIDLTRHLASWGIPVVAVEFCNSKLWAGNHDLNGADMVAVARQLEADRIIYAGFSAGGLAALAAAGLDQNTIAVFGLDLVDNKGLGKKIAPELTIPFYGLIAAPSVCNADNNGLESYKAAIDARVIEVDDATHCHFEFPFDGKCSIACGIGERRFKRGVIQKTILGLTTAFFLWQSGIAINGETWWSDRGKNKNILTEAGYIKTRIP
jgi:dienelactone hydrolase